MAWANRELPRPHCQRGAERQRSGDFEKLRLLLGPVTFFARLGEEAKMRLACKTRVQGDIEVESQPTVNWHGDRFWG